MAVTRIKQFPELISIRGKVNARNDLDVYSKAEVNASISAINLTPYTLLTTTASISGSLNSSIQSLNTTTQTISGNLTTDIDNLDLSMTQLFATTFDTSGSSAVAGSATLPANPAGFISVVSNGVTVKIPFYL